MLINNIIKYILGGGRKLPIIKRKSHFIYQKLGVHLAPTARMTSDCDIVGNYNNIVLKDNAEVNSGVFLLAKNRIEIGENSTLAYRVMVLTSANPNSPVNELSKIYPPISAPVKIGKNVWVGAGAIILPGVTIGDYSVVAAGSVVTRDVPSGVMVAGCPAKVKKQLK